MDRHFSMCFRIGNTSTHPASEKKGRIFWTRCSLLQIRGSEDLQIPLESRRSREGLCQLGSSNSHELTVPSFAVLDCNSVCPFARGGIVSQLSPLRSRSIKEIWGRGTSMGTPPARKPLERQLMDLQLSWFINVIYRHFENCLISQENKAHFLKCI